VIAADQSATSFGDIVRDRDNGFVFPAGDAEALARSIDVVASDQPLRSRMGQRSREIIGNWDYARGVDGVVEALNKTC
jgi:glycosyltransferase involved in cell wall biosynthesis